MQLPERLLKAKGTLSASFSYGLECGCDGDLSWILWTKTSPTQRRGTIRYREAQVPDGHDTPLSCVRHSFSGLYCRCPTVTQVKLIDYYYGPFTDEETTTQSDLHAMTVRKAPALPGSMPVFFLLYYLASDIVQVMCMHLCVYINLDCFIELIFLKKLKLQRLYNILIAPGASGFQKHVFKESFCKVKAKSPVLLCLVMQTQIFLYYIQST